METKKVTNAVWKAAGGAHSASPNLRNVLEGGNVNLEVVIGTRQMGLAWRRVNRKGNEGDVRWTQTVVEGVWMGGGRTMEVETRRVAAAGGAETGGKRGSETQMPGGMEGETVERVYPRKAQRGKIIAECEI